MPHKSFNSYAIYARDLCYDAGDVLSRKLKFSHLARLSKSDCVMYRKNLKGHTGCVNAVEFSKHGAEFIASGGDDKRVLLWNTHKALTGVGTPVAMAFNHQSNIFCLEFDNENKTIISGGNDRNAIIHDIESRKSIQVYQHEDVVYGISVDPFNSNLFGTAGDDGRILITDIRAPQNDGSIVLATSPNPMHGIKHNPNDSRIIASANSGDGAMLWDVRKPKKPLRNCTNKDVKNSDMVMSVAFDSTGRKLMALRKWSGPVLYDICDPNISVEFEQDGYFNSCTMKSCTFAGEKDGYLLSGSDDFNLYVWKAPEQEVTGARKVKEAHCILKGHRSIVNQVRYNQDSCLIASSGVEKIVKVWSPFPIGDGTENSRSDPCRKEFTTIESIIASSFPPGSRSPTAEDPSMLAFFDELIRRDRLGDNSLPLEWYISAVDDQNGAYTSSDDELSEDSNEEGLDEEREHNSAYGNSNSFDEVEREDSISYCSQSDDQVSEESASDEIESCSENNHPDGDNDNTKYKVSPPIPIESLESHYSHSSQELNNARAEQHRKRNASYDLVGNYAITHWKKKKMDELATKNQDDNSNPTSQNCNKATFHSIDSNQSRRNENKEGSSSDDSECE